jgi:hypothetical protein
MKGMDIYILLAFAPFCWRRPVLPHWRRPVTSLAIALRFTGDHLVDDAQLVMPCWADTETRPFFQHNRESDFDEAILSRIHLKLRYGNLSADARKKVWGRYFEKACADGEVDSVSKEEIESLVSKSFNGRQVCSHLSPSILTD